MRTRIVHLLDAIVWAGMATTLVVFLTGGFRIPFGASEISVRGIANPVWLLLAAAALRRLLDTGRSRDPLERAGLLLRRTLERHAGPGGERLVAPLALRLDAVLLAALAAWMLSAATWLPHQIDGDGSGYYAYLRSLAFDHDLDFHNEYGDFDPRRQWLDRPTATGLAWNPFPIGPAIYWAPFFGLGWLAALLAARGGFDVAITGYSPPFVYAVAAGTWLLGIAGVVLLYRMLLSRHRREVALTATIGIVLVSPLAYYIPFAPFYSHTQSFFTTTLFLWLWTRTPPPASARRWALLGLAAGAMAITRWQDAVLWALPALSLAAALRPSGDANNVPLRRLFARGVAFLAGVVVLVTPQLAVFRILHGFWLGIPQGDGFVALWPHWLEESLFSWHHGLYSWSPFLLVSTLGLFAAAATRQPWAGIFLAGLALQIYGNGSVSEWWAGHAYGARRLVGGIAFHALGLAYLLEWARARERRAWLAALLTLLGLACLWNILLMRQWILGQIPHEGPIDPAAALATAWHYLVTFDLRQLLGEDTILGVLAYRLSDLVHERFPLVAAAAIAYLIARRRIPTAKSSIG